MLLSLLRGNPPKISSKFQFSKNSVFTALNTGEYDKKIFFQNNLYKVDF